MAVAQASQQASPEAVPVAQSVAFLRFFGALCLIPSIRRIGLYQSSPLIDLWIQLTEDTEDDELRIYAALDDLDAKRLGPLVDIHVLFSTELESAFPRDAAVVFERP